MSGERRELGYAWRGDALAGKTSLWWVCQGCVWQAGTLHGVSAIASGLGIVVWWEHLKSTKVPDSPQ